MSFNEACVRVAKLRGAGEPAEVVVGFDCSTGIGDSENKRDWHGRNRSSDTSERIMIALIFFSEI